MKKILIVAGTRPNFIKITRFKDLAAQLGDFDIRIVHTGQHYDKNMAEVFFKQLQLEPDYFLGVGSGSPAHRLGTIVLKLSDLMNHFEPDLIIVPGDVDSTLAAALFANKMGISLAHLESGLRSFDREMPEEVNRVLTDQISDYCFVTEESGLENLRVEFKPEKSIYFVGNTMIDTLVHFESEIESSGILKSLGLRKSDYALMTFHRPRNVDNKSALSNLRELIKEVCKLTKAVLPLHPRTLKQLQSHGLYGELSNIKGLTLTEPLGYFDFQALIKDCSLVITDSGGIQEESTYRMKPCITLRPNTERPVTIELGSNSLCPFDTEKVVAIMQSIMSGSYKSGTIPPLWDGHATERILGILSQN